MSAPTRATYRTMAEGTAQDYALIERAEAANNAGLVDRVLGLVEALADGEQAYPVSRLDHSLQSATRAFDDGRTAEYVVAALLHDIGDTFAPPTLTGGRSHPPSSRRTCQSAQPGSSRCIQNFSSITTRRTWAGGFATPGNATADIRGSATRWNFVRSTTRTASTHVSNTGRLHSSGLWSRTSSPANHGTPRSSRPQGSGGLVVGGGGRARGTVRAVDVELPAGRADERNHEVSFVSRSDAGLLRRWRIVTPPPRRARNVIGGRLTQAVPEAAHPGDPPLVVGAFLSIHGQHLGMR